MVRSRLCSGWMSSSQKAVARSKEVVLMEGRISGEMLAPELNGAQVSSTKLMLDNIRRAVEYGSGIAIDLAVAEPQQT